jgi:hypothetical protein
MQLHVANSWRTRSSCFDKGWTVSQTLSKVRHIPVDIIYGAVIVKARCYLERCQEENNDARGMHCGLKVERKNWVLVPVFIDKWAQWVVHPLSTSAGLR